ncbi:invasin domain 3-containing protein [Enterobacter adelaidei]
MKDSPAPVVKRRTAVIGWLTIVTQAAFPLSLAFTPAIAAAQSRDSASDAEKWYRSGTASGTPATEASALDSHASSLAAAGSALSEGNASGMARSAAAGAAANSVEEWLSQFGTARVQLNLDEDFKADGSEADLLVPLYQNDSALFFTQLGYRHKDDRNTGNLGLGARYLTGDWMLGVNTFYDNDFTGDNRRMGVGVEAWRDYLKLSANSYIRLSDWHQSRDFADYDERPANGYDIRAEGWLPAYPQLGAKAIWEQYRGDEVALFGKDNRQKDPWAFTGGLTYTPVPLVTLGVQHRAGKDGENDSQVNLQMNYRLGESWDKQLDPGLVGASRTLAGTRYDLVERNNTIVLDYRKQESVQLTVPEKTTGKARTTVPIAFSVKTKGTVQRIDWDAASLVAAGGSLVQTGSSQLSATLPAYQTAGSNIYRFAGVAYDTQGNSGSATGEIHVQVGDVQPGATKVTAEPASILADGKSTSVVSIALVDADGNAVPGMKDALKLSLKEGVAEKQPASRMAVKSATLGAPEETAPGQYQATVTAGTRVSSLVVSSSYNGTALPDVTIAQTADASSGHIADGAMKLTVDNSVASGTAANQVQATITDAGNNPLAGMKVTFALSGSATAAPGSSLTATTDDQGGVSLSFVDKVAEAVTVTATLDNGNSGKVESRFIADSSTATLSDKDISVDKTSVIANNADVATFTALVKDANGNPVPDFTVSWGTDKGTLGGSSSKTDASGKAQVTLKHTVAEAAQVTAQAGQSGSINAPAVTFIADSGNLDTTKSSLAATPATIVADGTTASTVTLTLKDVNNNPVSGQTVAFVSSLAGSSPGSVTDNGDGTYTAQLTGTTAGTANITVTVGGNAFGVTAAAVTLTADADNLDAARSSLAAAPATIIADGTTASTVTLSLKDRNDNPVSGQTVAFASSLTGSTVGNVTDNGDGTYTAQLTGTTAGTANITVTVGGNAFGVNAASVILTADAGNLDAARSSLAAAPATIVADGTTASTVTLSLKDRNDNPVSGQTVAFASSLTNSAVGNVRDNGDGTYTAQLTGTTAGTANITVTVGGSAFGVTAVAVTLTADAGNLDAARSSLAAAPATIVADGTTASTVTLSLKDRNDNPVSGQTVAFASSLTGSTVGNVTDNGDGTYTAQLTGTTAGTANITVTVGGNAFGVNAASVILTADAGNLDAARSSLTATPATIVADGTTASTVTLSLKDRNDNPVSGQAVAFASSLTNSAVGNVTDNGDGTYTAQLTGTTAGTANVTVTVGGSAFGVTAASVILTADAGNLDAARSSLAAAPATIVADGTTASTVTLSLKDRNDNPVSGQTVAFASSLTNSAVGNVTDNGDGTYTAALTGTTAGTASITVTVGGSAFGVTAATVTLTADADNLDAAKSALVATPATIVANGTTASTVTLSLKDRNDNPVSGQTVAFVSSLTNSTVGNVTDNGDGTYTAQLTGTKAGDTNITLKVNSVDLDVTAAKVTLIADATTAQLSSEGITVDKTTLFADDTEVVVYTAVVKDAFDNPVRDQVVVWSGNPESTTLGSSSPTDSEGKSQVTLKGTREQTATLSASVNNGTPVNAPSVNFKMPEINLTNGGDITAQDISSVLSTTEATFIHLYSGHWVKTITFPAASEFNGKSVKIINEAFFTSTVTVNGSSFETVEGTTYLYKSNGSTWVRQ